MDIFKVINYFRNGKDINGINLKILPSLEFKRQLDIYSKRIQIMSMRESEVHTLVAADKISVSYDLRTIERAKKNCFLLKSFEQMEGKKFSKIKLKSFDYKEYKRI